LSLSIVLSTNATFSMTIDFYNIGLIEVFVLLLLLVRGAGVNILVVLLLSFYLSSSFLRSYSSSSMTSTIFSLSYSLT